ncbi:Gfo/Idh/MocA family protein [Parapedobacter deserti]|uniref:Gfo/Idh/MocA family protein n=1 Tax=Parapedobacter deserti TaxID=1912957 RepID=A0ABV7JPA8_9SPHI
MDRKHFLRHVGLLGIGAATARYGWGNTNVPTTADTPVGVGVIGCGDRGKGIMHTIKNSGSNWFKTVAHCDLLDFRLAEAKKITPSATAYRDYRHLLDNPAVAAVVVAVPLHAHFAIAKDALLAGKHVYLEKTMTFTIPEALELVQMVESRPSQVLQVGYQYRYSPLYIKVKELIRQGQLGEVTQVDCRWDRNNDWRRKVSDPALERLINWRLYKEYSGGLVAELLSHQMDFIHWVFDTHPDEIMGFGGVDIYRDGRETYDNVQLTLRYNQLGMIGNFGTTLGNARDGFSFRIKGNKGTISLLFDTGRYYPESGTAPPKGIIDGVTGATAVTGEKGGGFAILPEPTKDGTIYALEDFHQAILTGKSPLSNVHTGAKGAICASLANQSLYAGEPRYWKPEYSV